VQAAGRKGCRIVIEPSLPTEHFHGADHAGESGRNASDIAGEKWPVNAGRQRRHCVGKRKFSRSKPDR
jgi:hypothetical protein